MGFPTTPGMSLQNMLYMGFFLQYEWKIKMGKTRKHTKEAVPLLCVFKLLFIQLKKI